MVLSKFGHRGGLAPMDRAKEILRLVPQLIQIGTDGDVTIGHDEPPLEWPGVRTHRAEEVRMNHCTRSNQVDSVLSADWRHPVGLGTAYRVAGPGVKEKAGKQGESRKG